MRIFHSPAAPQHDTAIYFRRGAPGPHPESPERYAMLCDAAASVGDLIDAGDHGLAPILAVHSADYVDVLRTGFDRAAALNPGIDEVVPTDFPLFAARRRPEGITGQLGYHMTDTSTPLRAGSWDAIYGAAQAALSGAEALASDRSAYALCRPPGHHASTDQANGFCYLNNAAIAAQHLRGRHDRVAVLDIDVHHGNGTQAIFYDRDDVLTVSVHAETSNYFPFFSGYADEQGDGAGFGHNLNIPLPLGSDDDTFCEAIATGLDRIAGHAPGALVVALGLDTAADDPIGAFRVSERGFARAARLIAERGWPTLLVQEGGYPCEALGRNLRTFLTEYAQAETALA